MESNFGVDNPKINLRLSAQAALKLNEMLSKNKNR